MDDQLQTIEFTVKGMSCPSCLHHVQDALQSLEGVEAVAIKSWRSGETRIQVAPGAVTPEQIQSVLQDAGYRAVI